MPAVADGALLVEPEMIACIEEIAAGAGVAPAAFWSSFAGLVAQFEGRNQVAAGESSVTLPYPLSL